jgi:4-amino-4-deoxy-L-arabinose transferase-like glycosyltransferase
MRPLAAGLLLTVVLGALFLSGLGAYPLLDPDEARHAEVAREMTEGRGLRALFLPTLELRPYREKPPGFYWLATLSYATLGVSEAAARLPSAIAALVTVLAVYAWAVPRHGVQGALGAALVLATSAGCFGLARFVNVDMTLTACVAVGVLAGLAWLERPGARRMPLLPFVAGRPRDAREGADRRRAHDGPLALAWALARPRPPSVRTRLSPASPRRRPSPRSSTCRWRSSTRATCATSPARTSRAWAPTPRTPRPSWYYVVWLPALFLPWTLFAPAVSAGARASPSGRALVAWAIFVPAVLTLARGKLATYALSALVPLALLVGPPLRPRGVAGDGPRAARSAPRGGSAAPSSRRQRGLASRRGDGSSRSASPRPPSVAGGAGAGRGARSRGTAATARRASCRRSRWRRSRRSTAALVHSRRRRAWRACESDRDAAALVAAAGPAPVLAFSALAPSMVFYLRAPRRLDRGHRPRAASCSRRRSPSS